jgi:IPT/TIG domain-containing protein
VKTPTWVLLAVAAAAAATAPLGCSGCGDETSTPAGGTGAAGPGGNGGAGGACTGMLSPCDGECVDLTSDPQHCGSCDGACAAGDLCCESACVTAASCDFAVTSLAPKLGMQNGGEWLTLHGAGFAPGMRVYLGDGRAPTRVTDATTATIQTPPGLPGLVDVRIELGAEQATLPGGFEYGSAGLMKPWKEIPMSVVRGENPGVSVLQDARVLIAGGTLVPDEWDQSLDSAELFDRRTEQMNPAQGPMTGSPRWQNSAITLLDGRALVVGGGCLVDLSSCVGDPTLAHLFDPATDTFTPTAMPFQVARAYTRSVLLPDGRVFVASGNDASIEIYDPETDAFTLIAGTTLHRFGFVVRLRDGRVLIGGGDGGVTAAELFDPDTDVLTPTGPLTQGRSMLTAHTLPDGHVMVIGGASISAGAIQDPLASIELYDPTAGTFSVAPYALSIGRCWHASALVRDGTVLAMGGYTVSGICDSSVGTVDQIDPVLGTVTPFDALPNGKRATEWNAVTLLDGSIVAVGGGACGTSQALPEVYFLPGAPIPE